MAESVDALVSNTSGATRAGSTPALGTELERSLLLSFFYMFIFINSNLFRQRIEDIFLDDFQKKSYIATKQNQIFLLPLNSYEYSQITF